MSSWNVERLSVTLVIVPMAVRRQMGTQYGGQNQHRPVTGLASIRRLPL